MPQCRENNQEASVQAGLRPLLEFDPFSSGLVVRFVLKLYSVVVWFQAILFADIGQHSPSLSLRDLEVRP